MLDNETDPLLPTNLLTRKLLEKVPYLYFLELFSVGVCTLEPYLALYSLKNLPK